MMVWLLVLVPTVGALGVRAFPRWARRTAVAVAASELLAACVAALASHAFEPRTDVGLLALDSLAALLLPYVALLVLVTVLGAPRGWATASALAMVLVNEGLLVSTFLAADARLFGALWVATCVPVLLELGSARSAEPSTGAARVYTIYLGAGAVLLLAGLFVLGPGGGGWRLARWSEHRLDTRQLAFGMAALLAAVFVRKAAVPFHSWLPHVLAARPTGPVLMLVAPMVGALALARLGVPLLGRLMGPGTFLLGPLALVTGVYAAGLALVQRDMRRTVAWLVMSQSAMVLLGLECPRGAGLAGGILTWLASGTALACWGISAWMLEDRFGRLWLAGHQGLYRRCPDLGRAFLVSGLSLVAFPGMAGFVAADCLYRGVLRAFPVAGLMLFVSSALNGFTVLWTYMRLFHGPPAAGVELRLRSRERLALALPLSLLLAFGLWPAPLVDAAQAVARELLAIP